MRSMAAMVLDALTARTASEMPTPDTGSVREDVRTLLRSTFAILRDPSRGPIIASLMAEAQGDPAFATLFRDRFVDARREALAALLRRGAARGELPADSGLELFIDLIYGAMWYRLLNRHAPLSAIRSQTALRIRS